MKKRSRKVDKSKYERYILGVRYIYYGNGKWIKA